MVFGHSIQFGFGEGKVESPRPARARFRWIGARRPSGESPAMNPAMVFSLFPPFPRDNKVFGIIPHAPRFEARWIKVIDPAIREAGLVPTRLDPKRLKDSTVADLSLAIATHKLIFADVTEIHRFAEGNRQYSFRNAQVFYGLGMAHSARQPGEVLIFRSDQSDFAFENTTARTRWYDPENHPDHARVLVVDAIREALAELELTRSMAVRQITDRLDYESYEMLTEATAGPLNHPGIDPDEDPALVGVRLNSLFRLLDMGLVACYERLKYSITPLGEAVVKAISNWV
jgi:hypothetical protein